MNTKPNGILTFTTNGVPHLEIERKYAEALETAYRRGLKDGKKHREDNIPLAEQTLALSRKSR